MEIIKLNNNNLYKQLFEIDSNGREINLYKLLNVIPTGESLFYPNPLLFCTEDKKLYSPINETTMSLKNVDTNQQHDVSKVTYKNIEETPVFFFVYNTDNYFHFIYDTLPYLISFFELKKEIKNVKLLMNYPNELKKEFYNFTIEFLEILGIHKNDIKIIDLNTKYSNIFISSSYTHGHNSNLPPRIEIYDFYKLISNKVVNNVTSKKLPKKFYISRRSWIHGDFSNIGTNYTTRRKMINEDELVNLLIGMGYEEVFTETLTTIEKIILFANAEKIVGAIGGGLCNVLFSNKNCELISIISPHFLEINERFIYSIKNVDLKLFYDVEHVEKTNFKCFMRVKYRNIIGEIVEINNDDIKIMYSETMVSGWNNDVNFKTILVKSYECIKLDDGLNSSFKININTLKNIL